MTLNRAQLLRAEGDRKRIRVEDCETLKVSDLRPMIRPGDAVVTLADGTRLDLLWCDIRGAFATGGKRGTATSPRALCPSCGHRTMVLRLPPGADGWGCRQCLPLIYRTQRRAGAPKGYRKPSTHTLATIDWEQERIARLLGLPCWPPPQMLWTAANLAPARRLNPMRRDALLARIDALETLRVICWLRRLWRLGVINRPQDLPLCEATVHRLLDATGWAMRENWRRRGPCNTPAPTPMSSGEIAPPRGSEVRPTPGSPTPGSPTP